MCSNSIYRRTVLKTLKIIKNHNLGGFIHKRIIPTNFEQKTYRFSSRLLADNQSIGINNEEAES